MSFLPSLLFCSSTRAGEPETDRLDSETRELVRGLTEASLEQSLLTSVCKDEESFWLQLVETKLDSRLDSIENIANLKSELMSLRNMAVGGLHDATL